MGLAKVRYMPVNETGAIQSPCDQFHGCQMRFFTIFEFFWRCAISNFRNFQKWISKSSIAPNDASDEPRTPPVHPIKGWKKLTLMFIRAPMGYSRTLSAGGGGGRFVPPPAICRTTGPILYRKTTFDSSWFELLEHVANFYLWRHWWRHRSGQS